MSLYTRYRRAASAYWNINRLAMRAGARALTQRVQRIPRQPTWSLGYASMVEFMTLGTPKQGPMQAQSIREPLDQAASLARLALVTGRPVATDLWQGEWVAARHARCDHVILYLHGGGYVSGSPRTHRALIGHLSRHAQARILALDYRLAPEHAYPAALEDAWAAYRRLLNQDIPSNHIAVAGDSAGGGLTLALLMALRDAGVPLPASAICFSPWVDLALTGGSLHKNKNTDFINWEVLKATAEMYLGGHDPCDPLVSPLYGNLQGLPPLLVQVGSAELLYDDGRRLAHNARRAGVDVQFDVYPGMVHVFQFMYLIERKSRQAVHAAARSRVSTGEKGMAQNQPQNQSQNQSRSKSGRGPAEQDPKGRRTVFSTDPEDDQGQGNTGTPVAAGVNPAGPIATRQKNQPVIVGIERKGRGGKTVSVVAGVMSHDAGKQALLKLLKTKLGTGGTLKDDTIEIQGDHRDQIVEILTGLGYKAKKSGG